jgi:hypothetical protein
MLDPVCVAVLTAVLIPPLALGLRRRWRTRTSVLATRLGARLPPTWRPPGPGPVTVLDPTRSGPPADWSRYAHPACLRRAPRACAVTSPSSHKEDPPC